MKFLLCSILLMMVTLPATAAPEDEASADDLFYLEIGVVNDFPTQAWPGYSFGGGGQAALGYVLDPNLSIQFNVNDLYFVNPSSGLADNEIRVYPELKFFFSTLGDIRPYVVVGTGIDFQILANGSASNWINEGGFGLEWTLQSELAIFVEVKWTGVTSNVPQNTPLIDQDIPLLWGLHFPL